MMVKFYWELAAHYVERDGAFVLDAEAMVDQLRAVPVVAIDGSLVAAAIKGSREWQVSIRDALILRAAQAVERKIAERGRDVLPHHDRGGQTPAERHVPHERLERLRAAGLGNLTGRIHSPIGLDLGGTNLRAASIDASGKLLGRISMYSNTMDGMIENQYPGGQDGNDRNEWGGRAKLRCARRCRWS